MNCKKCGFLLTKDEKFCRNCGESIKKVETKNNFGKSLSKLNKLSFVNTLTKDSDLNSNKKKINVIIFIVVLIIIFFLFIFLNFKLLKKDFNNKKSITDEETTLISYKIDYNNFTFELPSDVIYEISNDSLLLADCDETWVVKLLIIDGNFNQIKNNQNLLQNYFLNQGFKVSSAEIKVLDETEFVTLEMANDNYNFIGAYAKLSSTQIGWLVLLSQDNVVNYDILTYIAPIIASVSYNDLSNSLKTSPKLNFNIDDISEFGQYKEQN